MKRYLFSLLLLNVLPMAVTAQRFSIDTTRLNRAYEDLSCGERNAKIEIEFLESYPTTWLEFYMTYCCDDIMCDMCSEHISALFGLSHINDTVLCKKIVNLSIGMKHSGECTGVFQDYLVGYILNNEELVFDYLSKLRKGHQMQFWQFCWSTVTECLREEHFKELYNRNKEKYPELMNVSRIAFDFFYDGINYPTLLPHKEYEYRKIFHGINSEFMFDGYEI